MSLKGCINGYIMNLINEVRRTENILRDILYIPIVFTLSVAKGDKKILAFGEALLFLLVVC